MQVPAVCMVCAREGVTPETFLLSYYDDRVGRFTCSRGHQNAFMIQAAKFEVLLESGTNALAEGFTLEASASFAAARERFFEFCIKVFCVNRQMSDEVYKRMFKEMDKMSERQLGAFLLLHAYEFGHAYKLNDEIVQFRNKVIHKGQIPTMEEAQNFCGLVYEEIYSLSNLLRTKYPGAYDEVQIRDLIFRAKQIDRSVLLSTTTGMMLWQFQKPTFREAFEEYAKVRERMQVSH